MNWIFALLALAQGQAAGPEVMITAGGWGFNQIDPQTGQITKFVAATDPTLDVYGMTHNGSGLVAVDRGPLGVPLDKIVEVHPSDGKVTPIGLTGFAWNIAAIEFDPTTGTYWAAHIADLYTLDVTTGAMQPVGSITGLKPLDGICGLAINKQGQAYGLGYLGGAFYSLDLQSAKATLIGDLPFWAGHVSGAAFDSSGRLFVTWRASGPPLSDGVYEVDMVNLTVNLVVPNILATGLAFGPATAETPYCTSKTNSQGCDPTISSLGLASSTASSGYEVIAAKVANRTNGRLIYSVVGGASTPFASGTWCVASPWNGTSIVDSGGAPKPAVNCSGTWRMDMNTVLSQKPGPQAGDSVYCQWIGRDRGFAPPDNYALTGALEFTLLP